MQPARRCAGVLGSVLRRRSAGNELLRVVRPQVAMASTAHSSVDDREIENFENLSSEWLSEETSFKPLYSYNKIRVPWIADTLVPNRSDGFPLRDKRIIDVACGGGILSVPLARLGASVVGIDAAAEVVNSAREAVQHFFNRRNQVGSVTVECSTVEEYAEKHPEEFDAVVASEVVEHVNNLEQFVNSCITLAKHGAPLFFTTLNKTIMSRVLAIWMAEDILKIVPSGVHDWSKFVEPSVLRSILEKNGCAVRFTHGVTYNPVTNVWGWSENTAVNYAMMAIRQ